jgi:glycosyltransferase involved in cell wall biosynthesis
LEQPYFDNHQDNVAVVVDIHCGRRDRQVLRASIAAFDPELACRYRFCECLAEADLMTSSELPFVSIVIPARNEEHYLAACLRSILDGTYPLERLEILIVDGNSDDRTREIANDFATRYHSIQLLENPAAVVPNAMNIGIGAARGEFIVRMDAHARYGPDYVMQLITWIKRLNADNVGGVFVARPATDLPEARAVAAILSHSFGMGGAPYRLGSLREPYEVDTVPFGCYRRDVFDRIGLFDELFIRNQDDELNARLLKAGGRIFLIPEIKIDQFQRSTLRKMGLMLYQYGYFKPLVAIKLGRPATWRQLVPPAFTAAVLGPPLLFFAFPWVVLPWGMVLGFHCAVNLGVSFTQARRQGWPLFSYLFYGYLAAHLSYGFGYLRGILDFGLLRRHLSKAQRSISLSR